MAIFQEPGDAGATIDEAAGIVSIPEFDKIEGSFSSSTGDVDFYELQLDSDAQVDVKLSNETNPVALFDSQGNIVSSGDNNALSFNGEAGETFFLKVGRELGDEELALTVITEYEVTLDVNEDISDGAIDAIDDLFDKCAFDTEEDDTFNGNSKDEILLEYNGNNTLNGFRENDTLVGGQGFDILNESRSGSSSLYQVDLDWVFERINLSAIDVNLNIFENQAFDFIDTNCFTAGSSGQVRYDTSNNLIQVEVHSDGDTVVDIEIASDMNFSWLSKDNSIF